jgi:hypothetical protein
MLWVYGGYVNPSCECLVRRLFADVWVAGADGLCKGRVSCVSVLGSLNAPCNNTLSTACLV